MNMEDEGSMFRESTGINKPPQDHNIVAATKKLQEVIHYLALSTMLALLLLIIFEYNRSLMGSWVIYTILLLGQSFSLLQLVRCVYLAVQPLLDFDVTILVEQGRRDRRTWTNTEKQRWDEAVRWQNENSELFLLLQKTVAGALWIFFIVVCVAVAEMIALWGDKKYAWVIPLYIFGTFRLFNSLLCLSMSVMEIMSWVLALTFLILYNIKEATPGSSAPLDQTSVSIPLLLLLGLWLFFAGYTLMGYIYGAISLRTRQLEALVFYVLSFSLIIACVVAFDSESTKGADNHEVSSLFLFFGAGILFTGVHISTQEALDTLLKRRGAFRPLPLTQDANGGWTVDEANSHGYNILIGEYDVEGVAQRIGTYSRSAEGESCLLRSALMSLQTLDRILLALGIDCLGCFDDKKGRREKHICAACCDGLVREALCTCACCSEGTELHRRNSSEEAAPMLGPSSDES